MALFKFAKKSVRYKDTDYITKNLCRFISMFQDLKKNKYKKTIKQNSIIAIRPVR